jgi:AcrR family transcriptional regulator
MTDLRKKQKRKREEAIVEAAKELIGQKGYRDTSIEEIALKAEVGTATVYNYFTSKSGLLMSIFNEEFEILLESGEKILGNPPAEAEEAVYRLSEAYFSDFMGRHNRQLMREIFVAMLVEQLSIRKEQIGLNYDLMAQLVKLLEFIKGRGQIRDDIRPEDAAFIIYSLIMTDLMAFLVDDDMTIQGCLEAIKRQIYLVFKGFTSQTCR